MRVDLGGRSLIRHDFTLSGRNRSNISELTGSEETVDRLHGALGVLAFGGGHEEIIGLIPERQPEDVVAVRARFETQRYPIDVGRARFGFVVRLSEADMGIMRRAVTLAANDALLKVAEADRDGARKSTLHYQQLVDRSAFWDTIASEIHTPLPLPPEMPIVAGE